jgi:hypothetical protein
MLGLYRPSPGGVFSDVAHDVGVAQPSFRFVTFGCAFVDVDNDSQPDILTVNGYTDESLRYPAETYSQPSLLLRNRGAGKFAPIENIDALESARGRARPGLCRH